VFPIKLTSVSFSVHVKLSYGVVTETWRGNSDHQSTRLDSSRFCLSRKEAAN